MLYGRRVHQSRTCSGSVVACSCQLPRSAGSLPPTAQGNTYQPRAAMASAAHGSGSRSSPAPVLLMAASCSRR